MPDLKDQMIEEEQEQRERMHQAVDDIEATMHTQEWYMSLKEKTPPSFNKDAYELTAPMNPATRVLTSTALWRDISTGVWSTRPPLWTAMEPMTPI